MVKGMLSSLNSSTATNAASTTVMMASATESRRRGAFWLRSAITAANSAISQAQNSSEPSRPAHKPDSL